MKTTNYFNTFIAIAEDCPLEKSEIPPQRPDRRTAAGIQYEMIAGHPYAYTSDDVLFAVYAEKNSIPESARSAERDRFFSKGQPCFRSSPLTKRYGWGVHSDEIGRIAIYAVESDEYRRLCSDQTLEQVRALRSKRA